MFFKKGLKQKETLCHPVCRSLIWDPYGRWVNDSWKPFVEGTVNNNRKNKNKSYKCMDFILILVLLMHKIHIILHVHKIKLLRIKLCLGT